VAVSGETPMSTAWRLLQDHGIRQRPVLEADRLLMGMVSDDNLRYAIPSTLVEVGPDGLSRNLASLRVNEALTWGCRDHGRGAGSPGLEVAHIMVERRRSATPVATAG
jgi:hypothetical protein